MPDVGTVFDYYVNLESGSASSWAEMVSSTKFAGKSHLADVIVSTPAQVCLTPNYGCFKIDYYGLILDQI
jgi:hypothetical protein